MRGRNLFGAASALVIAFAAPAALAQDGDPPGDASTQARISAGQAIEGEIAPAQDQDWYRFQPEPGQRYRITVDALGGDSGPAIDPMLFVYDLAGAEIAYNDDAQGTLNSALHFTHDQRGEVFLAVRAFSEQSTGGYRIAVAEAPLPPDDFGNDATTRGRIAAGRSLNGSLEYEGDVDWFRLSARAGQTYRIALNGGDGDGALGDPLLRVMSRDGEQLAYNDDGPEGLNSLIEFTPDSSGDVFIEARAFADAYTGAYTLSVESARLPADPAAASTSTRARINVGESIDARLDYAGDRDWYRIRLTQGETYRFALASSGETPVGDPLLRLYDGRGTEVAMDDDGGGGLNSLIEYTAPATGNYYVEARGYSTDATGTYTLRAIAGDIPADASTDATLSAQGDYRQGVLSPAGDRDWYRIDLEAGQGLRIALSSEQSRGDPLGDPYIVFYGPDGAEVGRDDDSGGDLNAWFEYQAAVAGPHYLEVRGFSDDAQGRYAVSISAGEIGADPDTAEPITPGMPRFSTISPDNDVDWFVIEMIEGRPYRIAVFGLDEGGLADPHLSIYGSDRQEILSDDDGGPGLNSYISFTPVAGGPYFVAVSAFQGTPGGRYAVIVTDTEVPGHAYTDEYLDADAGDERLSRIDMPGDLDVFRVELQSGVTYQIDVASTGEYPLADPYLTLLDASGQRITADDDSGDGLDARLRFRPTESGQYLIQASGLGGAVGEYRVSIRRR